MMKARLKDGFGGRHMYVRGTSQGQESSDVRHPGPEHGSISACFINQALLLPFAA
jgi:hypothetical protein